MTGDAAASPTMRADARRNRERLLEAAQELFAEEGLGVPVDEIAARAGVGAGTLYRHFPTKEALFEAVVVDHMLSLAAEARALSEGQEAGAALFSFLGHLAQASAAKRNLIEALAGAGIDVKASAGEAKEEIEVAARHLLARAQEAGEVRPDVTLEDLFGLVMGACYFAAGEDDASSQARMLSVVCAGLRSAGG